MREILGKQPRVTTMNQIGIDVKTTGKAKMIAALAKLKTTLEVTDGGMYHEDNSYSVVRLDTVWTEEQVDEWCCRVKAGDGYIGTFQLL
jgi:hypothetical protein